MVARASHCGRRHNQSQTVSRELRSTAMLPRMIPEPAVAIHEMYNSQTAKKL